MLPALVSLAAVARCELMVVSPGTATAVSLDALCASCRALAALRSTSGARVTLLLREPDLEHEHIESVVRDLAPLFAPDCLVLHEKCAGARLVASEHGLGVHVKSTLGCTGRGATRTGEALVAASALPRHGAGPAQPCTWLSQAPGHRMGTSLGLVR